MNEKELKHLSRADLLEMLIDQSKEVQILRKRLEEAENALRRREIIIGSSGSIAEASLKLSGIFEAAQAACEQYIENIQLLNERQESSYQQFRCETKRSLPVETVKRESVTVRPEAPRGPRMARRRAANM